MVKVNIAALKAQLSHYLKLMQNGQRVIIMKRDLEIGEIVPPRPLKKRVLGLAANRYPHWHPDDSVFLEPMSKKELALWEDSPLIPEE